MILLDKSDFFDIVKSEDVFIRIGYYFKDFRYYSFEVDNLQIDNHRISTKLVDMFFDGIDLVTVFNYKKRIHWNTLNYDT